MDFETKLAHKPAIVVQIRTQTLYFIPTGGIESERSEGERNGNFSPKSKTNDKNRTPLTELG